MKRHSIHAILTLCALAALVAPAMAQEAEPEAAGPKAVIAEPIFDAEAVPVGEKIVHDFVVRNEGTEPLEITSVRPACGCTVAEFDRTIGPGGSGKIHAVLDTSTFAGPIAKNISVFTSDAKNPRLDLTIKAKVEPYVFIQPGYARFVQPQLSDPGVVEERLWTKSFDNLQILGIESPYPFLAVTHEPLVEDLSEGGTGPQHRIEITLDYTKAPVGALADYVVVTTNHPKQPEVRIPVSGFVRPLVVLTPETADFGRVQLGDDGSKGSVIMKYYGDDPIEIESVETTVPGLTATVEKVQENREFHVHVTLGPDTPKGDFAGLVRVKTNLPRKPTVEIPVKGTVT
jgi:hypothetical protein